MRLGESRVSLELRFTSVDKSDLQIAYSLVFEFIALFYIRVRRHSAIGCIGPLSMNRKIVRGVFEMLSSFRR